MNPFIIKQLDRVRQIFDRWMQRRAGEYPFPEDVECVENYCHDAVGPDHRRMDIYYPRRTAEQRAREPLPIIVNIHGGGMVLCDRKTNRPFCAELAKRGFGVFCLDYPLVPQADIPEILREVAARMEEVGEVMGTLNGDPDRVYLVGDSAGAFISVYELAAQKNPEIARALDLTPSKLKIRAAAFISGMFYTARMDSVGSFLRKDFYGKDWKNHPFRPYADPAVPAVAGTMPPCYLVTAKLDNLRNYTLDFVRGLKAAGVQHHLADLPRHPEMNHDFVIIKPESPKAQEVIDEICDFLTRAGG